MQNEIFFNELCLQDKPANYEVLSNLIACYQRLKSEKFSVCRLSSDIKNKIFDYLKTIPGVSVPTITNFFYSFFHEPFEKTNMPEEIEEKFIQHELYFENQKTEGFLWAYTYETLAFSLLTNIKWNCDSISVVDKSDKDKSISIHHAATVANIDSQKNWIDSLKQIVLLKANIPIEQKQFHVRDDHGIDVLKNFWNKLKNCEYVISCINSLPFNSFDKELIINVKQNGQIELVLYWTDKGLGMVIQTTGRNIRETQKIADIIAEKYSK